MPTPDEPEMQPTDAAARNIVPAQMVRVVNDRRSYQAVAIGGKVVQSLSRRGVASGSQSRPCGITCTTSPSPPATTPWLGREPYGDRVMPLHQGIAGLTLHLFTRREAVRLLHAAGFAIVEVRPIGLRPDGQIPWSWWFGNLRAYGYLLAAERPT